MKRLIQVSAVWNILLALVSIQSGFAGLNQADLTVPYFNFMIGAMLFFTSAVLILAARDLANRASLVFWEGFLRIGAALTILLVGISVLGNKAYLLASTDLAWAAVYHVGLMRALKKSYWQLLTDG